MARLALSYNVHWAVRQAYEKLPNLFLIPLRLNELQIQILQQLKFSHVARINVYNKAIEGKLSFGGLKLIESKEPNRMDLLMIYQSIFGYGPYTFIDDEIELFGFFGVRLQLDDGKTHFIGYNVWAFVNRDKIWIKQMIYPY